MHDDSTKLRSMAVRALRRWSIHRVPCAHAGFTIEIPILLAIVCSSLDHLGDLW